MTTPRTAGRGQDKARGRKLPAADYEGSAGYRRSSCAANPRFMAAEVSVRRNAALVATGGSALDFTGSGDNSGNPLYPVGNSAHAQVSLIHTLERSPLWEGGLVMAEVAWNRRTSITKNAAALDPNTTRDALGFRVLMLPTWYQAMQRRRSSRMDELFIRID